MTSTRAPGGPDRSAVAAGCQHGQVTGFATLDDVTYGEPEQVSPLVRRVIAENPSKFTYRGTGTYIVGHGEVAVIDPGPDLAGHRDALAKALDGEHVISIAVTHCHSDHSPLAAWLRAETGAPTYAFGPHPRPDPTVWSPEVDPHADSDHTCHDGPPARPSGEGGDGGVEPVERAIEEAVDFAFTPDVAVADGDLAGAGRDWSLRAVHTPGHTSNHTCFALAEESTLFPGDHVMGWSTTVVAPPDGDMAAYIDSLRKVASRSERVWWPTHGPAIRDPGPYVEFIVDHRLEREAQVLDRVRSGVGDIATIVAELYAAVPEELHEPAGHSVLSHLVKLVADGAVTTADGTFPRLTSRFVPT